MKIVNAGEDMRGDIIQLLQSQKLPTEDLPLPLKDFYVAIDDQNKLMGLIGMERYGSYGLLRSMVVDPQFRNQQIAGYLVNTLEQKAVSSGIKQMFLLTETADRYFTRKGYDVTGRDEVPAVLQQSSEFSHVCPSSAIVMKKHLQEQSVTEYLMNSN